ncbi:MAG: hypothetical protein JSR66_16905 [Proteobacteria bacterium]|nr:hypothetical protein [Pseudomonadota bacterium]
MPTASAESLSQLVTTSRERLAELARAGDRAVLIAAAQAAADAIEHRVGPGWAQPTSRQREPDAPRPIGAAGAAGPSAEHQALLAAQRFTFNVAADCWPGWALPKEPPDPRNLLAALELARHSVALVKKLELGPLRVGTGTWLCGAFELALGRRAAAVNTFTDSLQHYRDAHAPGLALLTEGYLAIARAENVENVCAQIAAGGYQDGGEWIEQLRVAAQVFAS